MLTILSFAVLTVMALNIVGSLFDKGQHKAYGLVKKIRLRHLGWAFVSLTATIVAAVIFAQVPGLGFGWWSLLGGEGNALLAQNENTSVTAGGQLVTAVILTLLVAAMPILVHTEEEMFREGTEDRTLFGKVKVALVFGAVHLIVGVPIYAALALAVAGGVFTVVYQRAYKRSMTHKEPLFDAALVKALPLEDLPHSFIDTITQVEENRANRTARVAGVTDAFCVHLVHNAVVVALVVSSMLLA